MGGFQSEQSVVGKEEVRPALVVAASTVVTGASILVHTIADRSLGIDTPADYAGFVARNTPRGIGFQPIRSGNDRLEAYPTHYPAGDACVPRCL